MVLYTFEDERNALIAEKEKLQREIHAIREQELLKRAQRYTFNELRSAYRKMPVRFLKTVFHTRRDTLLQYASLTFDPFMVKRLYDLMQQYNIKEMTEYMVLYCCELTESTDGYKLTLMDTNRTVEARVSALPENYPTYKIKGHILQVKITVNKDFFNSKKIKIESMMPLPYTLNEEEVDGIARPIETRDYDQLKELDGCHGRGNKKLCMDMAYRLVQDGARRVPAEEQGEETELGFIYIRGKFRKYFLFFNSPEVEAIVYPCGGLTSYEMREWDNPSNDIGKTFDKTYLCAIMQ